MKTVTLKTKIVNLSAFAGRLPPRVTGFVVEWASLHQQELMEDWRRSQSQQPLWNIDPLE
ncbi:MAG TPA: DUF4160 domain-containing protein [bacterium]|nr:DUF4160 domain-containing protein [bacterium]